MTSFLITWQPVGAKTRHKNLKEQVSKYYVSDDLFPKDIVYSWWQQRSEKGWWILLQWYTRTSRKLSDRKNNRCTMSWNACVIHTWSEDKSAGSTQYSILTYSHVLRCSDCSVLALKTMELFGVGVGLTVLLLLATSMDYVSSFTNNCTACWAQPNASFYTVICTPPLGSRREWL